MCPECRCSSRAARDGGRAGLRSLFCSLLVLCAVCPHVLETCPSLSPMPGPAPLSSCATAFLEGLTICRARESFRPGCPSPSPVLPPEPRSPGGPGSARCADGAGGVSQESACVRLRVTPLVCGPATALLSPARLVLASAFPQEQTS